MERISQLESRWTSAIFIVYNEHHGEDGTPALGLIWRHPTRELTLERADCFHLCGAFAIRFHFEYCGVWSKTATVLCNKVTFNMPHRTMLINGRMHWVWRALIALITSLCKGRHDRRNLMSVLFKSKADALMKGGRSADSEERQRQNKLRSVSGEREGPRLYLPAPSAAPGYKTPLRDALLPKHSQSLQSAKLPPPLSARSLPSLRLPSLQLR